jgi:hypothetical protein
MSFTTAIAQIEPLQAGMPPIEHSRREQLPPGAEMLRYLRLAQLLERVARAHCLLVASVREGCGMVVIDVNAVGTRPPRYLGPISPMQRAGSRWT